MSVSHASKTGDGPDSAGQTRGPYTEDRDGMLERILAKVELPRMVRVRQTFPRERIEDIPAAVSDAFRQPEISGSVKPGMSIAITVGSRGIASLPQIVRAVVSELTARGAEPFVIPAMGSHGGATASGQRQLIESLGVTEETVGAPVRATMDTVEVGRTEDGKVVRIDRHAAEADGIVVLNRVKPHTTFRGRYESGLMKMMAIGLGKQSGAESCHSEGFQHMLHSISTFANTILEHANILFGVPIVENAYDEVYRLGAIPPSEIPEREPALLEEAKSLMPSLGFSNFDVLIIDKIGKNYSGDGMDPNIAGRFSLPYASGGPDVQRYVVLSLSAETHGNFNGIGLADYTTKRAFEMLDFAATYPNPLTSRVPSVVKIPAVMPNDRLAIQAAIQTSLGIGKEGVRLVRIPNTAHIEEMEISESLVPEARKLPRMSVDGEPAPLEFDSEGNLTLL